MSKIVGGDVSVQRGKWFIVQSENPTVQTLGNGPLLYSTVPTTRSHDAVYWLDNPIYRTNMPFDQYSTLNLLAEFRVGPISKATSLYTGTTGSKVDWSKGVTYSNLSFSWIRKDILCTTDDLTYTTDERRVIVQTPVYNPFTGWVFSLIPYSTHDGSCEYIELVDVYYVSTI